MKALTLKHPWPFAICRLGKRIENRTWEPYPKQLKVGDWLAIHGGVAPRNGAPWDEAMSDLHSLQVRGLALNAIRLGETILPGIVAVCRFGGVVTESEDPWFSGPFGWLLEEATVLLEPVACKGAQGLWEIPEGAMPVVRRRWKAAREAEVSS